MQTTNCVLLIRPSNFVFNAETADSNAFQQNIKTEANIIKENVLEEFELFSKTLQSKGVQVCIYDDTTYPIKPDAVFPNNWVSFHSNGDVVLYPMFAENRRAERRIDIIESLRKKFKINIIHDFSIYEKEGKFLEGTGSIVFDHKNKIAYACLSPRTNKDLLLEVCKILEYKAIYFNAYDLNGKAIYHTNVMMCIGNTFAVICLDSISDKNEKSNVINSIENSGKIIIDISHEQMNSFAGNMLCIHNNSDETFLVMSQSAHISLTIEQINLLQKHSRLLPISINTIETIGGGSTRCMIAEIFLPKK